MRYINSLAIASALSMLGCGGTSSNIPQSQTLPITAEIPGGTTLTWSVGAEIGTINLNSVGEYYHNYMHINVQAPEGAVLPDALTIKLSPDYLPANPFCEVGNSESSHRDVVETTMSCKGSLGQKGITLYCETNDGRPDPPLGEWLPVIVSVSSPNVTLTATTKIMFVRQ